MELVDSNDFINRLIDAKVLPDLDIRRVVIDFEMDKVVVIYYETLANKKMIDLGIEELIKNKDKLKVIPVEDV